MGQGDVRRSRRGPAVIKSQVIRQKSGARGITQLQLRNYSFLYNNKFPQADKPSGSLTKQTVHKEECGPKMFMIQEATVTSNRPNKCLRIKTSTVKKKLNPSLLINFKIVLLAFYYS